MGKKDSEFGIDGVSKKNLKKYLITASFVKELK
jgi:hypothetical protein